MFRTAHDRRSSALIWLALTVSLALHLVLLAGAAALDVTVPGSYVASDRDATPSVATQVESVDQVLLDS